jgi:hypothetical protein
MSKAVRYAAVGDESGGKTGRMITMRHDDSSSAERSAVPWRLGLVALLVSLVVGLVLGAALATGLEDRGGGQVAHESQVLSASHGYDHRLAYRLLLYSDAIYCRPRDVLRWDCPVCDSLPAFSVTGIAGNVAEAVSTLVGYDAALDAVVVSFRGTVLGSGLQDPAGHESTTWGFSSKGVIRSSSVRRYDSHRTDLHELIRDTIADHPSAPVYCTGHSLGGAQALVASADLPAEFPGTNFTIFAFAPYRQSKR